MPRRRDECVLPASPTAAAITAAMSFDEVFGRLVRVSGWALGIWAIATRRLEGAEAVTVILAFVGFELVSRYRESKLPELEDRRDER
jgi:hypothetical protein